ncbi:histidine triad (HIT) protein [Kipferlia bialata]|uniref:Histidine triad (HIT) protein n=1 Tax=Kipferlia bialata TaxID=797122 RepID=A0A9K3GEN8_9EUKA|nr:histidine triad (HIT) protein [Kipferlia bialata]|eukprot:g98.t1
MADCIFCKIIAGDIPCHKVYEDEDVLAFLDIDPGPTTESLASVQRYMNDVAALSALLTAPLDAYLQSYTQAVRAHSAACVTAVQMRLVLPPFPVPPPPPPAIEAVLAQSTGLTLSHPTPTMCMAYARDVLCSWVQSYSQGSNPMMGGLTRALIPILAPLCMHEALHLGYTPFTASPSPISTPWALLATPPLPPPLSPSLYRAVLSHYTPLLSSGCLLVDSVCDAYVQILGERVPQGERERDGAGPVSEGQDPVVDAIVACVTFWMGQAEGGDSPLAVSRIVDACMRCVEVMGQRGYGLRGRAAQLYRRIGR